MNLQRTWATYNSSSHDVLIMRGQQADKNRSERIQVEYSGHFKYERPDNDVRNGHSGV